jgi:hypothetical protein
MRGQEYLRFLLAELVFPSLFSTLVKLNCVLDLVLFLPGAAEDAGRACAWDVAITIGCRGSRRFVLILGVAKTVTVMSGPITSGEVGGGVGTG